MPRQQSGPRFHSASRKDNLITVSAPTITLSPRRHQPLPLHRAGDEAFLDLLAQEDVDEKCREGCQDKGGADRPPLGGVLAGKCLNTDRQGLEGCLADEDVREHQLVPALQEGIDTDRSDSRFHQRADDTDEDAPDTASVDTSRFVQIKGDLIHEACADKDGHGQGECSIRNDKRPVSVQHMQTGKCDIHRNDRCVDRDRQTKHEELVQRFAALPDKTGKRKGSHNGRDQCNEDRRNSNDDTVHKVDAHFTGFHGTGIVGPQPMLRKANDILTKDLCVVFQREGKHPVNGEQVDKKPEDQSGINEYACCFGVISHGINPPV